MRFVSFAIGAFVGWFATSALILATEVVRAYRNNTDTDPWNEYASEEKPESVATSNEWQRITEIDELKKNRAMKLEQMSQDEPEHSCEDC